MEGDDFEIAFGHEPSGLLRPSGGLRAFSLAQGPGFGVCPLSFHALPLSLRSLPLSFGGTLGGTLDLQSFFFPSTEGPQHLVPGSGPGVMTGLQGKELGG